MQLLLNQNSKLQITCYNESMPLLKKTRASIVDEIKSCKDWATLFDTVNQGLSSNREKWGDDLIACSYAAQVWGGTVFPVSTHTSVQIWHRKKAPIIRIRGQDLESRSFLAAKILAQTLLSPLPTTDDWEKLFGEVKDSLPIRLHFGSGFLGVLKTTLQKEKRKPALVSMERRFSWEALDGYLQGEIGKVDERLLRQRGFKDEQAKNRHFALKAHLEQQTPLENIFNRIRDEFGFQWVSTGPLGGMERAQKVAHATLGAFYQLSEMAKIPPKMIALQGMMIQVNGSLQGAHAHFSSIQNGLMIGNFPTGLAHEWIHGLDYWCKRNGDEKIIKALNQVRKAIKLGKEVVAEKDENREDSSFILASIEADKNRYRRQTSAWNKHLEKIDECLKNQPKPKFSAYFQKEGELLARAGETFFANANCPTLAQTPGEYNGREFYPQADERKLIHKCIKSWFKCVRGVLSQPQNQPMNHLPLQFLDKKRILLANRSFTETPNPLSSI